jgi:osmotically-inducible protein OsmY
MDLLKYCFYGLVVIAFSLPGFTQVLSDAEIAGALVEQYNQHPSIKAENLNVSSADGIVTITGKTRSLLEKEKVLEMAESMVGVRAVIDMANVVSPQVPDKDLERYVSEALLSNSVTSRYNINAKASNGIIELSGEVQNYYAKSYSEKVAKNVVGVRGINNKIRFTGKAQPDNQLKQEIVRRLNFNSQVDNSNIRVEVAKGKAILSGTVRSAKEKTLAREMAWIEGVAGVEDKNLKVDPFNRSQQGRNGKFSRKTDEEIRAAIQDAFRHDVRLQENEVAATVKDGIVTLHGTVLDETGKRAAGETARNVVGVREVRNHAEIRHEASIDDGLIRERAMNAIKNDPFLQDKNVHVAIRRGEATIKGEVDTRHEFFRAEDVVSQLAGVTGIINEIEVKNGNPEIAQQNDEKLKQRIIDFYRWATTVDHNNIDIRVENGKAYISGQVDNNPEFLDAEQLAYDAGAIDVINNIEIVTRDEMMLNRRDR